MANLPVYSSRAVRVSYLAYDLEGLAPDSFVEFALSSDLTDEEIGADGSVAISISPDQTGTCTISLQYNSPSNVFLSGVLNLQRTSGQLARGSFTIRDPSGGVIATLTDAHLKTAPTVSLGSSATGNTQDWVFFCQKLHFVSVPEGVGNEVGLFADAIAAVDNVSNFLV